MEPRASALAALTHSRDLLTQELEAMSAIGRELDGIADPAVRQRILRWAAERFHADAPPGTGTPAIPVSSDDPALAVDSLGDLFEDDRNEPHDGLKLVTQTRKPAESTLRSFVADFQRLAKDWHDV